MRSMFGAILRGLRARALLSAGSVLLTALAVASAVLGPIFAEAVTNSYVITKVRETSSALTGTSRVFTPDPTTSLADATRLAVAASRRIDEGPWAAPVPIAESPRFMALRGAVTFWAREGACEALQVTGRCPEKAGEVLMLASAAETAGVGPGERLELVGFEPPALQRLGLPRPPITEVEVVGTYVTPTTSEHWLLPLRLSRTNEQVADRGGGYTPYSPGPLITTPGTVEDLGGWTIRVEAALDVPADVTAADLDAAARSAAAVGRDEPVAVEGGTLVSDAPNDLANVAVEVRQQEATARSSIAPAVLSLVLVALALLMRLLNAASEIRVPELALASLRGVAARRLWALGLAEPVALLLIAAPVGVVLGIAMSWALVRAWLVPGLPLPLVAASWWGAALVMVAAFAVACVAVGLVVRESLAAQLSGVRRPVAARRWSVVAQLTLVALAGAALLSKVTGAAGDPDAIDLVLPVLLAVVAGLAATRATAWFAQWWTRRSAGRSLSGFVSMRAISRRQEGTLVILPLTAAIAVAVFGAGVQDSAASWRTSVAAIVSPADTTWSSPLSLAESIALTREIDPDGEWVMAAGSVLNPGAHFSIVDSSRLAQVATWPSTWSPGRTVADVVDEIRPGGVVPTFTGRRISLTVDNRVASDRPLAAEIRFGTRGGVPMKVYAGPFPAGTSTRGVKVPWCREGCPLEGITLGGGAGTMMRMHGTLRLDAVLADGEPVPGWLDGAGWTATPDPAVRTSITDLTESDDGLDLVVDSGDTVAMARLTAGGLVRNRPALRGPAVAETALDKLDEGYGLIPVDPVATIEGMPFVGPAGLLVDYSSYITDRPVYDSTIDVRVLQREGAPERITDALSAAGFTVETTLARERQVLDQGAYALALRLYGVVAALVLLMALAGLFVSTAVQLPARRRDAAALRVVGVPRRSVMLAVARELLAVLGSAALAGIAAGSLAQWLVLRTITLGYAEGLATPALVATISPLRLVLLAVLAAVVFGVVAMLSAALTVRGARGSTLRESAR